MNILILNQPVYNRGDEAAHRSLIRALNKYLPDAFITIVIENINKNTIEQIRVDNPHNHYVNIKTNFGYRKSRILSIITNLLALSLIIPSNRLLSKYIKRADIVFCAPGGICLGGFYNWSHLYIMLLCKYYRKQIYYYSRSIGPFNPHNLLERVFCRRSINFLRSVDFLSLRDAMSMKLADKLSLNYVSSIDTAFLDISNTTIPDEINNVINEYDYVVFVPNKLTWHHSFKDVQQLLIDNCYLKMIEIISERTDYRIIMLPQLYNAGAKDDYKYFINLKNKSNYSSRITVVPDIYSSDIQQSIVKKAKMIIGARYHSIIFGINNLTPIIALNYEHKIVGTLKILDMQDRMLDFYDEKSLIDFNYELFTDLLINKNVSYSKLKSSADEAHKIALSCFNKAITNVRRNFTTV